MDEKRKDLGYKIGTAVGTVIAGCAVVVVIAVTIKFVMWLF